MFLFSNSNQEIFLISDISGLPLVRVPVLSKITMSISFVFSNVSAFFISIHFLAHDPVATIIAAGVVSHNAHGQAITRVATAAKIACELFQVTIYQDIKVIIDIVIIIGTNICEILSTSF
jgi:hypothetical protein